jgi:hypothetical protein
MARGAFQPLPGEHCRWCDFLVFCDAGREFMAGRGVAGEEEIASPR